MILLAAYLIFFSESRITRITRITRILRHPIVKSSFLYRGWKAFPQGKKLLNVKNFTQPRYSGYAKFKETCNSDLWGLLLSFYMPIQDRCTRYRDGWGSRALRWGDIPWRGTQITRFPTQKRSRASVASTNLHWLPNAPTVIIPVVKTLAKWEIKEKPLLLP